MTPVGKGVGESWEEKRWLACVVHVCTRALAFFLRRVLFALTLSRSLCRLPSLLQCARRPS